MFKTSYVYLSCHDLFYRVWIAIPYNQTAEVTNPDGIIQDPGSYHNINLDKLNMNEGLILGSSKFFDTDLAASKYTSCFKSVLKWYKNNDLAMFAKVQMKPLWQHMWQRHFSGIWMRPLTCESIELSPVHSIPLTGNVCNANSRSTIPVAILTTWKKWFISFHYLALRIWRTKI